MFKFCSFLSTNFEENHFFMLFYSLFKIRNQIISNRKWNKYSKSDFSLLQKNVCKGDNDSILLWNQFNNDFWYFDPSYLDDGDGGTDRTNYWTIHNCNVFDSAIGIVTHKQWNNTWNENVYTHFIQLEVVLWKQR